MSEEVDTGRASDDMGVTPPPHSQSRDMQELVDRELRDGRKKDQTVGQVYVFDLA